MTVESKAAEELRKQDLIREYKGKELLSPEEPANMNVAEPWLPIETKLVIGSLIGGVAALIVLATLIHIFILGGLQ
jgi:hypothetical protein